MRTWWYPRFPSSSKGQLPPGGHCATCGCSIPADKFRTILDKAFAKRNELMAEYDAAKAREEANALEVCIGVQERIHLCGSRLEGREQAMAPTKHLA